jgi:uncharacterized protein YidB (DUF937 family)
MMGLFDQVSDLLGGGGGGGGNNLVNAAVKMVGGNEGLQGLMNRFDAAGLAEMAQSWVGTGDNRAVSPDQVRAALGDDEVHRVAQQAGMSDDEAASGLAGVLPDLVNRLTPDGKLPDLGDLQQLAGKFLGR